MSKLMVSVSGVRGIFGETINPAIIQHFSARFGIFSQRGKIIIGRDSRTTGLALQNAVISGLLGVGCDVVELGIVSTPTVLMAVENDPDAQGGIAITASHNPAQWNALKFVGANGMFLFPENADDFLNNLNQPVEWTTYDKIGKLSQYNDAIPDHIDKILAIPYLEADRIRTRKFKVVIDSVNGAGGLISPRLLKELGCEVIEINSEPTGIFAHSPEPLNQNLTQLQEAVRKHKADVGFATDPDVDRLSIIDENGECLGEEFSLLLAENFILAQTPGTVVTNLSSSMASEDIAAKYGASVIRTRIGEINVGKKMMELGSPIGGEGNGGIICPDVHYTRDAPAGIAIILAYMAQKSLPVSKLAALIPRYYFAKNKVKVMPDQLDQVMAQAEVFAQNKNVDRTDGIKIIAPDHWIHIRKSGTEPIVRVYVESTSIENSSQICQDTIDFLIKDIK
ncbi:MAG: phosphoglucosamine mutase [Candidatus Stygibacter australis]|nr:phosphoglucosamine mutase [Candidatus Stygibacter australis]MDP8321591.1 phosphoglucosamine mutase [Candidatus Stygibacter australis]